MLPLLFHKSFTYKNRFKWETVIIEGLGDTDAYLWRTIGENLEKRKNVALIHHIYAPNAVPPTQMQKRGRLEREQQELIRTKMGIKQENWTNEIKNKLFFTLNKSIFKL